MGIVKVWAGQQKIKDIPSANQIVNIHDIENNICQPNQKAMFLHILQTLFYKTHIKSW